MNGVKKYRYFACDAGPHLVIPSSTEPLWTGIGDNYDPTNTDTDYYRACQLEAPAGLIDVGNELALILGGNPAMTAYSNLEGSSLHLFVIEGLDKADPDRLIDEALESQLSEKTLGRRLDWSVTSSRLTLMFAGDKPSHPTYGKLQIDIHPGTYRILPRRHEGPSGRLWLLRFEQ